MGLDARCNDSVPRSSMAAMAQRSTRGGTRGMGRCDVTHRRCRLVRTYTDTLGTELTCGQSWSAVSELGIEFG